MSPRFCVLVTSHNYRDFIAEAVDSALAQVPAPAQVVIVDDGSSDGSPEFLRQRYGANPAVRLVLQDNRGQFAAIAAGHAAAEADVIALLDADDTYAPGYLEALAKIYSQPARADFVYCDLAFFGAREGRYSGQHDGCDRSRRIGLSSLRAHFDRRWLCTPTSGISMRRALLARVLDLPARFYEDWRICADLPLGYGSSILGAAKFYLHEPLVNYRVHGGNRFATVARKQDPLPERLLHEWKQWKVIAHYGSTVGLTQEHLRFAKSEFKTWERTRWVEARDYLALAWRAPTSLVRRLADTGSILRHWWRTRGR